jgi:hypothetical protein
VHVALVQQLLADGLARAALEQHVVGQHHGGAAVLLEQRLDVLHEVELLVAGGGPEVVALDHVLLGADFAFGAGDHRAALLAEGRIRQHHVEALAGVGRQRVGHHDGHGFVWLPMPCSIMFIAPGGPCSAPAPSRARRVPSGAFSARA